MRLQKWEQQAIKEIQDYGGFLTKRELHTLYLQDKPGGSPRQFRRRRKQLADNQFIKSKPITSVATGELHEVFYLGTAGAKLIADRPRLTGSDRFVYRARPPRYFDHDYLEAQTHRAIEQAVGEVKKTKLLEWLHAFQLHRMGINVNCTNPFTGRHYTHEVVTDSFCVITHQKRDYRFFWEIDNETRREPELTKKRLVPYVEMIRSRGIEQYGGRPFRVIWLAHTPRRIEQIKHKLEVIATKLGYPQDANYFLLTTFDQFKAPDLMKNPIYLQGGNQKKARLFSS